MTLIQALIDLQTVDGRIRELEAELKDLPRRKAQESARLTGFQEEVSSAKTGKEYTNQRVKGYEEEANLIRERISQMKTSQASAQTNKEYQQYSMQIDLMTHDLEAKENQALAAMDDVPSAEARIANAMSKFEAEQSGVNEFCQRIDERIAQANAELAKLQEERKAKLAAISDKNAILKYERLRTKRWPVVAFLTHEGVCDGCHLVQPPSIAQEADANAKHGEAGESQHLITCTMCGRILYRD